MAPIRILHVGLGARGRDWLDFVDAFPGAESAGLVEPDAGALAEAQKRAKGDLPAFATLAEGLAAAGADAALIASPSRFHAEQALSVLDAGLAALIEKPFAPDVAAAQSVIDRSEATGRPVVVAENFRFVPVERTVREAIRSGSLGRITNISLADRRRMPLATHGSFVEGMTHAQLSELAVHHFDSLRSFTGKRPLRVTARAFNPPGSDYAGGACTEAFIELEDDLHVQYLGTMTSNKFAYRV